MTGRSERPIYIRQQIVASLAPVLTLIAYLTRLGNRVSGTPSAAPPQMTGYSSFANYATRTEYRVRIWSQIILIRQSVYIQIANSGVRRWRQEDSTMWLAESERAPQTCR